MTLLFVDTETTGIDRENDSIIQIAGTIMNETSEKNFNIRCAPYKSNLMDSGAEEKTGYTNEMIQSWPNQEESFKQFISILDEYINTSDWNSRGFIVGWNVGFDVDFIRKWMEFNNYNTFGKYFYSPNLDLMSYVGFHFAQDRQDFRNFKLESVYEYLFNESLVDAHDAMADINATRRIFNKTCSYLIGFKDFIRDIPVRRVRQIKSKPSE